MALFSQLGNYRNAGLLVMRAGIGAMMVFYGLPKLYEPDSWAGLGSNMSYVHVNFWPAFWGFMCVLTQTVGGLFCIIGLWFRLVCLLMIIVFGVAVIHHFRLQEGLRGAAPAIVLAFVYVGFLFVGPGKFSIDKG
jgi:putative oxidoreductase